jgi:hypothetical protein
MSYYEKYVKYKNKYISLKHNASAKNVVLQSGGYDCDNDHVYKNIHGTCWMVAIQIIFSFGDATSKIMGKNIKEVRNLKFLIEDAKRIPGVDDILPGIFGPPKVDYLMDILGKFRERYKSKVYDVRNPDYPHGAKLENKDRCELVIAENFKKITKDIYIFFRNNNNFGGHIGSYYLFSNILSIFLIGWKTSFTNYYNYEFSGITYDSDFIGILITTINHTCCFFMCNGVEKYCNDNDLKIFDCKWKEMLKKTSKHNCLYIQEYGCVLMLTDEEYKMRQDKSKLHKIEILIVLSKTWRPNSFDNDMRQFIKKNNDEIKDGNLNSYIADFSLGINIQQQIKHYEKAVVEGYIYAQKALGYIYLKEHVVKDINKSIKYFEMAAVQGNIYAQKALGNIYLYEHVVKDINKSIKYYEMAAVQGNIDAQKALGNIYMGEYGVKDIGNAIKYYEMAADQKSVDALCSLADIYSKESDIKDISKAEEYERLAEYYNYDDYDSDDYDSDDSC